MAQNSKEQLLQIFRPHQFAANEEYVDLWHVYDNLSQTPFKPGIGIQCKDDNDYVMNAWNVITPLTMRQHLNWRNRKATQFVSLYSDPAAAQHEQQRRRNQGIVPGVGPRNVHSVRIAHVRIPPGTGVWFFSRSEMLEMMATFGDGARFEMFTTSAPSEWFVWGRVPEELVLNRTAL
ncbi:hypothetical protein CKM354_000851900 [Cercospora kikuchii]|uniref:DUF7587 domain-containing protein n=1 Tax=Cercospora kikuchii TaxID=84275 RepID=A0A9P3FFE4_9PEZI|nr:uncharacterized protein CKM354_000851900 [Cercospora kikuchii]GIZ45346.1 hypothetical protein CKM354_000851900 [Cercospora kikuchii]